MAAAIERQLGAHLTRGIIVTKHGHLAGKFRRCIAIEAAHPVPDAASVAAASAVREMLQELNARDLLIAAISGGASALLTAPVPV